MLYHLYPPSQLYIIPGTRIVHHFFRQVHDTVNISQLWFEVVLFPVTVRFYLIDILLS